MLSMADGQDRGLAIDGGREAEARRCSSPPSAPLEVSTSVDADGAPLLEVRGEIDLSNASVLTSAIDSVTAEFPPRLVIDMSQVTFICSTGIRALIEASERAASVCLRAPSRGPRRVLEIVGLPSAISIES